MSSAAEPCVDVHQVLEQRQGPAHGGDPRRQLLVEHERLEIGVVEEVAQLLLDITEVHVDGNRPQLVGGDRRLQPLDAVGAVDPDMVADPDALDRQVVGQAVGVGLHLGVGAPLVADDQQLPIRYHVDRVLEQVGDVERHDLTIRQIAGSARTGARMWPWPDGSCSCSASWA